MTVKNAQPVLVPEEQVIKISDTIAEKNCKNCTFFDLIGAG
jgi:hypothetical protein